MAGHEEKISDNIMRFTLIIYDLREKYELTISEFCVLDSIYQLSKNIKYSGWCIRSKKGISEHLGISKMQVHRAIEKLIDKGLIDKDSTTKFVRSTDIWNEEMIGFSNRSTSNKMLLPQSQNVTTGSNKMLPNNNSNKNINKKKPIPPTKEEVIDYFIAFGYSEELAVKAFNYYEAGNWTDNSGKKVINWKQKMQSVWFKSENKPNNKKNSNLFIT